MTASPVPGPGGHWARGPDVFLAADVDGDGHKEIMVADNTNHWTGVLKWNGSALETVWAAPSPLSGPPGNWNRVEDLFVAADVDGDGHEEVLVADNGSGWTGLLK